MKAIIPLIVLHFSIVSLLSGQSIAINTTGTAPDTSAMLDVSSTLKGVLIPRMITGEINTIPSPAKGLFVYNNLLDELWFNAGTAMSPNWRTITEDTWSLSGNEDTNPATHFIGTTDNVSLVFRTSNIRSGLLDPINQSVFLGLRSGLSHIGTTRNIGIGASALESNILGSANIAIGDSALFDAVLGTVNIAVGARAGRIFTSVTSIFIGAAAGYEMTTGSLNIALGEAAMYNSNGGIRNLAIGRLAMSNRPTTSDGNIAIGTFAQQENSNNDGNTVIGQKTGEFAFGNTYCTFIGSKAGRNHDSGEYNIGIGLFAMDNNTGGGYCIGIGTSALRDNTSGNQNTAIGEYAFGNNETGNHNIGIGTYAGFRNEDGDFNVALGHWALASDLFVNSSHNVAIGDSCLSNVESTGGDNTAVGSIAGYSTSTGENNCFLGSQAASLNTTGNYNVAVGHQAMRETVSSGGNTALGYLAGDANDSGSSNTLIGSSTDAAASGYTGSTALGYNTAFTASDQVRVGWLFTTSIGGPQNWSNLSDGRFKFNVRKNIPGLDFILKLNPVTYELDTESLTDILKIEDAEEARQLSGQTSKERRTGFIAQEVEQAAHQVGYDFSGVDLPKNPDDMYGLRYESFVVPLVKAVQEQQAEILSLKEKSLALLERLEKLEQE